MGNFDEIFGTAGEEIIDLFVEQQSKLTRIVMTYNPLTAVESATIAAEVLVKISPPYPYDMREIDGKSIMYTDTRSYVSAKVISDLNFDITPASEVQIYCEFPDGRRFKVVNFSPIYSGDSAALYALQLRK